MDLIEVPSELLWKELRRRARGKIRVKYFNGRLIVPVSRGEAVWLGIPFSVSDQEARILNILAQTYPNQSETIDIAEAVGCPIESVKSTVCRLRKKVPDLIPVREKAGYKLEISDA